MSWYNVFFNDLIIIRYPLKPSLPPILKYEPPPKPPKVRKRKIYVPEKPRDDSKDQSIEDWRRRHQKWLDSQKKQGIDEQELYRKKMKKYFEKQSKIAEYEKKYHDFYDYFDTNYKTFRNDMKYLPDMFRELKNQKIEEIVKQSSESLKKQAFRFCTILSTQGFELKHFI